MTHNWQLIRNIQRKTNRAMQDVHFYADFVADMEFLIEQHPALLLEASHHETYDKLWLDMEIVNAFALDDLESKGNQFKWEEHRLRAEEVVQIWWDFLFKHFNRPSIKNRVVCLSNKALTQLVPWEEKGFIDVLDGKTVTTRLILFEELQRIFGLKTVMNWRDILEGLTDLTWLKQEAYALIIQDYADFLSEDKAAKDLFMQLLTEEVLPFWEREGSQYEYSHPRSFIVYLVDEESGFSLV